MPKIESISERQAEFAILVGWTIRDTFPHVIPENNIDELIEGQLMEFFDHWTQPTEEIENPPMLFEEAHNFNLEKELEKWLS